MLKILWLAPNFNHYKARFLNHLALEKDIEITIISGLISEDLGHKEIESDWIFNILKIDVIKSKFGMSIKVFKELKNQYNNHDWILIPAEKKNIVLMIYVLFLRIKNKNTNSRLFSYNHPILKSKNGSTKFLDRVIVKFFNRTLDRVIYYTEDSYKWALQNKLIDKSKAFWANNTIDNTEINENYNFALPPNNEVRILFIGRLIPSKRLVDLIAYYTELKNDIHGLKLDIIGDGPERELVKNLAKEDNDVTWYGTLINEFDISPIMAKCTLVFVPGHSGLSINHAFAYGRPYLTLKGPSHAPELNYIDNAVNGYVLTGNFNENIGVIKSLLLNRLKLEQFCNKAKEKGSYLSVQNWVQQIKNSLLHE